jgi:crossover junction endodeoxyribonuclease RusA
MRAYVVGGHPVVTHTKPASLGAWRQSIAARADEAMVEAGIERLTGAVSIELRFGLRRPRSHYGARGMVMPRHADAWPSVAPDIDKLVRAALDALTGVVFVDDGQVVELIATKAYAERPGLDMRIEDATGPQGSVIRTTGGSG